MARVLEFLHHGEKTLAPDRIVRAKDLSALFRSPALCATVAAYFSFDISPIQTAARPSGRKPTMTPPALWLESICLSTA